HGVDPFRVRMSRQTLWINRINTVHLFKKNEPDTRALVAGIQATTLRHAAGYGCDDEVKRHISHRLARMAWMAGTSPAMTDERLRHDAPVLRDARFACSSG
ncbi:hypothetical protein PY365_09160, partial [Roseiarcaceae bacterium H3SJ34-1]|uniref:hypothetical protein n=1 Tax=Terripilifer ovatus TaxID=3032367 RepID=UPI003AB9BBA1|nr:hypothetical protein [Roseiarcaceae bacterium H3SJ34-1]